MNSNIFDVVVIGSGLGGIRSSQELLKNNLKVCMITSKEFCSGASFYPKTWGLGMVGPKDKEDEINLLEKINEVGCNRSNRKLSKILVENISEEIENLSNQGMQFKESVDIDGVIPCFDSNKRNWYGFDFKSGREVFNKILNEDNFTILENTKVINLYNEGDYSKGILIEKQDKSIDLLKSKSIVIASGGFTCLFKHNFSLELNTPIIQYLCKKIGCELINLEFIQFIPAYLKPMYKTIFNERVFKYISLFDKEGKDILEDIENIEILKDERSTYGPFTTRLKSSIIDTTLFNYYKKEKESAYFKYPENIESIDDTLIFNYFEWLKTSNIRTHEKIYITPFAHACNGGLKIDEKASTNINGVFACGEATGGVHGADRIGGLSTVNALVFGKIAGQSASDYCKASEFEDFSIDIEKCCKYEENSYDLLNNLIIEIRNTMYEEVSILRSEESIHRAKNKIVTLKNKTNNLRLSVGDKYTLESYIEFSLIVLEAMLNQSKSIGCHCRVD